VRLTCELCGLESTDVRPGLACYADNGRFERIDRCVDHQSCRERLFLEGEDWPLTDLTYEPRQVSA
jgi:hypothetical protein